ncbi:MAG TPA: hypothetical protein VH854_17680 [Thermoanaerobaculia bacterium]|jgi:hypothetical protein|nr:hypothetical protein [Thermoanaerobaculia bacterium]
MSCRELERLFAAGAPDSEIAAHRHGCAECERVARDVEETASLTASLAPPVWSPILRRTLLEIPRMTVSCEGAEPLIASLLEGEIADSDESRLRNHLSRCEGCTAAAETLLSMRELAAPAPPPWLTTRLAAARPAPRPSIWKRVFSGKAVVAYAYAAAVLVMLLGLNPTAVARKAGFARLEQSTRGVVSVAKSSVGDRLGALQERALRDLAALRGRIGGYGRAAVSNALAIVLRPEPKKTPSRPRLGKDGGTAATTDDYFLARTDGTEPLPAKSVLKSDEGNT